MKKGYRGSQSDKLSDALRAEDELGKVVRAHIHIEQQLNMLLRLLVKEPKYLVGAGLTYAKKVDLAAALGMDLQLYSPLKRLGKIRNDFSHEPDHSLTEKDVDTFYDCLSDEMKSEMKELVPDFSEMPVDFKFAMICLRLHSQLSSLVFREPWSKS